MLVSKWMAQLMLRNLKDWLVGISLNVINQFNNITGIHESYMSCNISHLNDNCNILRII